MIKLIKAKYVVFYKQITIFALTMTVLLNYQNCSKVEFSNYNPAENISLSSTNPDEPNNCSLNGQAIAHGSSVTTYASANVPYGQTCQSQVRTCNDGVLSGSFIEPACQVATANNCVFEGQNINHGSSVTAYAAATVSFGSTCQSENRACNNGTLSGSYNFSSCSVASGASCTFNGQTITHGGGATSYQNSTVPFGQTCKSQVRTCNNGTLSGSYNFASCAVGQPQSCLFNGQTVAHGASITGYLASSVAFGQTCSQQTRTCNDGALSGSYAFASCAVGQPQSCLFNGQTVAHGTSVTGYLASSVAFGQTCSQQTRTCNNGALSGSYAFASCAVGQPQSCLFNGQTVAHGQNITSYVVSTVPYGSSCSPQTRTCNDGVLSGTGGFAGCTVDQPNSCFLNGQTVAHGAAITTYPTTNPAYGVACSPQSRVCDNGTLSGSYTNTTCTEKICNPNSQANCDAFANGTSIKQCNAQGSGYGSCIQSCNASYYMLNGACVKDCSFNGTTVTHGSSITAYQTESPAYGVSCNSQSRTCSLGTLSGSYTATSCMEKICAPSTYTSCGALTNGTHQKQCNASGLGFGSCVKTCNTGYYLSNGACVKDCSFNGTTITHGSSITTYAAATPAYGVSCAPQTRTCSNGTLSGSYTATSCTQKSCNPNTYTSCGALTNGTHQKQCNAQGSDYGSCVKTCNSGYYLSNGSCVKDCSFNGQTVTHGSSVTAYAAASVPFGSTCQAQTRTCNNGTLSGSSTQASCSVTPAANCSFNGTTVAHGASVTAYQSTSPAYGVACSSQSRTCNNGTLSGSNTATSCTPKVCNPGSYQSCGYLENGSHVKQCNAQGTGYGACSQSCNAGYTYYNGQCYLTQCTPRTYRTCYYWATYTVGDGGGSYRQGVQEMCSDTAQWELSYVHQLPLAFIECDQ